MRKCKKRKENEKGKEKKNLNYYIVGYEVILKLV
jgi:hypothetical protein